MARPWRSRSGRRLSAILRQGARAEEPHGLIGRAFASALQCWDWADRSLYPGRARVFDAAARARCGHACVDHNIAGAAYGTCPDGAAVSIRALDPHQSSCRGHHSRLGRCCSSSGGFCPAVAIVAAVDALANCCTVLSCSVVNASDLHCDDTLSHYLRSQLHTLNTDLSLARASLCIGITCTVSFSCRTSTLQGVRT